MNIVFLIDAENCMEKSINKVKLYNYIQQKGEIIVKRIYGDWKEEILHSRWKDYVIDNGFDQVQVRKINGKNSVDNRIIVDAMELLYTNPLVQCFVLLGSDKDYYSLVSKVLELGKQFIILGNLNSTSESIINKCSKFIDTNLFINDSSEVVLQFLKKLFNKSGTKVMLLTTLEKKLKIQFPYFIENDIKTYIEENFLDSFLFLQEKNKKLKVQLLNL